MADLRPLVLPASGWPAELTSSDFLLVDQLKLVGQSSDPASPADGQIWFNSQIPALKSAIAGRDVNLLAHLITGNLMAWKPRVGVAAPDVLGLPAPTVGGTATAASIANTNKFTYTPRTEALVTTAATTAIAFYRGTNNVVSVGATQAGLGGFRYSLTWGPATGVSNGSHRAFAGLANITSAPSDVEPSTTASCVAMGWDAADANVQMFFNDASGNCTKVDLGASFPVPSADRTTFYRLDLFSPPGTTQSVQWRVTDMVSNATASGTQTTDLPTTATLLAPRLWMSVGGVSSVVGLAIFGMLLDPLL